MKTIDIKDGLLFYEENWLASGMADKLLKHLKDTVAWKQEKGHMPFFQGCLVIMLMKGWIIPILV